MQTSVAILPRRLVYLRLPLISSEYITKQLVDGYKAGDNETQAFLNEYDFYIFPFVNPNGFGFSRTDDRLWRKNRQPPPENAANQTCFGRDINRNWEAYWDNLSVRVMHMFA